MSEPDARRVTIAAAVVFLVASAPTVLLLVALYSGSVGTSPRLGLIAMAFIVIAVVAASGGYELYRGLEIVASDTRRMPSDAWVAYYVGTVIVVIGALTVPLLMLATMVNSDRSLADSGIWFFFWWTLGHLVVAGLALGMTRLVFGTLGAAHLPPPVTLESPT